MKFFYLHKKSALLNADPVYDGCGERTFAEAIDVLETPSGEYKKCKNAPNQHPYDVETYPQNMICGLAPGSLADYIFSIDYLLFSERVIQGLVGGEWKCMNIKPVEIRSKRELPTTYSYVYSEEYLSIDVKSSRARVEYRCGVCGHTRYRLRDEQPLYLLEKEWKGQDIFRLHGGWAFYVVSERLASKLIELKPSGLCVTELSALSWRKV